MFISKLTRNLIPTILLIILTSQFYYSQDGIIKTYHPNGKIRMRLSYVNEILDGTSYWYYPNGNLESEKNYSMGKVNGWVRYFYETGLLKEEISVRDGIRDGLMKIYYENGALKEVRSYERGELIKIVKIENDPNYVAPIEAYSYGNIQNRLKKNIDLFLCEVDICPKPVGGVTELQGNLVYPEHAKLYGLEGYVTVIATINKIGYVEDVEIIEGLGLGCDEAAEDAVKKTKFLPGQLDGNAVECKVIFKVEFRLDEKSELSYHLPIKEQREIEEEMQSKLKEDTGYIDTSLAIITDEAVSISLYSCEIEVCPQPKGGLKSILSNLIIPSRAKDSGIEGEVIVDINVDMYGFVRDTQVLTGLGYGCDEAVEVALFETRFEPGLVNGNPVRTNVTVTVPIIIEVDKKEENE